VTLRIVIWPEASSARNSMAAVSAQGRMVWVLMRRLNSSCRRSIALEVLIDFHWLGGKRVKVNSLFASLLQAVGDGAAFQPPLADEGLAPRFDLGPRRGIDVSR
jgi:hypothetical protein